jgi:hypothetical protein
MPSCSVSVAEDTSQLPMILPENSVGSVVSCEGC